MMVDDIENRHRVRGRPARDVFSRYSRILRALPRGARSCRLASTARMPTAIWSRTDVGEATFRTTSGEPACGCSVLARALLGAGQAGRTRGDKSWPRILMIEGIRPRWIVVSRLHHFVTTV